MQGPKRFKIIKNDKNIAIVSSFIASILVECWTFCKETVNWWDGTSWKQNDLCRGPSRGLTSLKMARKKNLGNFVIFWLLLNSLFRFYPLVCWNLLSKKVKVKDPWGGLAWGLKGLEIAKNDQNCYVFQIICIYDDGVLYTCTIIWCVEIS